MTQIHVYSYEIVYLLIHYQHIEMNKFSYTTFYEIGKLVIDVVEEMKSVLSLYDTVFGGTGRE